jgi:hypothetical protein
MVTTPDYRSTCSLYPITLIVRSPSRSRRRPPLHLRFVRGARWTAGTPMASAGLRPRSGSHLWGADRAGWLDLSPDTAGKFTSGEGGRSRLRRQLHRALHPAGAVSLQSDSRCSSSPRLPRAGSQCRHLWVPAPAERKYPHCCCGRSWRRFARIAWDLRPSSNSSKICISYRMLTGCRRPFTPSCVGPAYCALTCSCTSKF